MTIQRRIDSIQEHAQDIDKFKRRGYGGNNRITPDFKMPSPVYFDHNATTPLDPAALAEMMPFLKEQYGNASSRHHYGREARKAISQARERVADAVGAHPAEVIFTSGGTESNNAVIKGVAAMSAKKNIAVGATEHPCVLCAARSLQRMCFGFLPMAVDANGILELDDLDSTLAQDCALASVMLANNETGVIQNIADISARAKSAGAAMHTDCAQALGKIPLDFRALGADAMTISAHKAYGPKGAAALVIRRELSLAPLLDGGGHEDGLRSGTENVAAIVGFGKACEIAAERVSGDSIRLGELRARMESGLISLGAQIFGANAPRLPNTTYFAFAGIDGETLVVMMDQSGFAAASGAACSSMKNDPSHVLLAMGVAVEIARGAVRISLGRQNTTEEVDAFLKATAAIVNRLRSLSAVAG